MSEEKLCEECGNPIPAERLEVLPDTTTCVGCSREKKYVGFNSYSHKTAPELVVVDQEREEDLRRAERANRRGR